MNKHKKFINIVLVVVIIIVIGTASYFVLIRKPVPTRPEISTNQQIIPTQQDDTIAWKAYRDETSGFEFKYPEKLSLVNENNKVILNHSIPYDNYGDCDMSGRDQLYKTLDDFNVSFEVVDQKLTLDFVDGEYSAGVLKGSWVLQGVEGCGYREYYFPIGENKTLVVQKAAIQTLSGLTLLNLEEILKIPGIISNEESDKLFNEILSTFKLVQ